MAKRRRKGAELARDRLVIAEKYLEGWTQAEIAEYLELSQQTISNDIKALQQQWLDAAVRNFDAMVSEELERINWIERQAREQWERSKENFVSTTKKVAMLESGHQAVENNDGKKIKLPIRNEATERTEERLGNVQFLHQIERCIEMRLKLLGLNAPEKIQHHLTPNEGAQTLEEWLASSRQRVMDLESLPDNPFELEAPDGNAT